MFACDRSHVGEAGVDGLGAFGLVELGRDEAAEESRVVLGERQRGRRFADLVARVGRDAPFVDVLLFVEFENVVECAVFKVLRSFRIEIRTSEM